MEIPILIIKQTMYLMIHHFLEKVKLFEVESIYTEAKAYYIKFDKMLW